MTRPRFLAAAACALTVAWVSSATRADVTLIDSFEDRPSWYPLIAGPVWDNVAEIMQSYPHVLGGRAVYLSATTAGFGRSLPVQVNIDNTAASSLFEYSSLMVGAAGNTTLEYGAPYNISFGDPSPAPLALSVNPNTDFLRLTFTSYNHANGDMGLNVVLRSGLTADDSVGQFLTALTSPGSQIVDIPLADLPGNTLNSIQFAFIAPPDTNFQLDSVALIRELPQPTTVASLLAACMLLLPRHRRRSRYNREHL